MLNVMRRQGVGGSLADSLPTIHPGFRPTHSEEIAAALGLAQRSGHVPHTATSVRAQLDLAAATPVQQAMSAIISFAAAREAVRSTVATAAQIMVMQRKALRRELQRRFRKLLESFRAKRNQPRRGSSWSYNRRMRDRKNAKLQRKSIRREGDWAQYQLELEYERAMDRAAELREQVHFIHPDELLILGLIYKLTKELVRLSQEQQLQLVPTLQVLHELPNHHPSPDQAARQITARFAALNPDIDPAHVHAGLVALAHNDAAYGAVMGDYQRRVAPLQQELQQVEAQAQQLHQQMTGMVMSAESQYQLRRYPPELRPQGPRPQLDEELRLNPSLNPARAAELGHMLTPTPRPSGARPDPEEELRMRYSSTSAPTLTRV